MTASTASRAISIVIACRDPLFGGALASAAEGSFRIAALVDSFEALGAVVDTGEADGVVAIDPYDFPPLKVMELTSSIPVLMVGPGDDSSALIACVEAGALGYADFEAPLESLVQAMSSVVQGVPVIPPLLLGSLLKHVVERQRGHRRALARLEALSAREREVFELMARGSDRHGVAEALFISPATVRTHVQNLFRKLNLHSVAELVALAAECGLELGRTISEDLRG